MSFGLLGHVRWHWRKMHSIIWALLAFSWNSSQAYLKGVLWLLQAFLFCYWQESVDFKSRSKSISPCLWDHNFCLSIIPLALSEIQHAVESDPYFHGSVLFKWIPLQMFPLFLSLQGIWRIPVDEIDRPGSFASHMNRSIVLLLNVLSQLKDYNTLLKVSSMLQRTPDQGKYDRFILSHYFLKLWIYFVHCMTILFKAVLCLGKKVFRQIPLGI